MEPTKRPTCQNVQSAIKTASVRGVLNPVLCVLLVLLPITSTLNVVLVPISQTSKPFLIKHVLTEFDNLSFHFVVRTLTT